MKALNVLGIILAWFLSIALVLMLAVAPVSLSALTVLDPEIIMDAISDGIVKTDEPAADAFQEGYSFEKLSAENAAPEDDMLTIGAEDEGVAKEDVLGGMMDSIQELTGENISEEMLESVLNSNFAKELVQAYVEDVTNAVTGKTDVKKFTPELIVDVVEDNLDEILDLVEKSGQEIPAEQKEQLKGEIKKAVEENAQEIAQEIAGALPDPSEIIESNEEVKAFITLLAQRNQIKWMIIGTIAVIALLIFALRYPGFRGLRWLSTDLFIAGGINVVICLALSAGTAVIIGLAEGLNATNLISLDGIVSKLVSQFTAGVIVRTVFIFVAAIALLVGYILLKKFVVKKVVAEEEVWVNTCGEAPSYVPTAVPVDTVPTTEPESAPAAEEKPAQED